MLYNKIITAKEKLCKGKTLIKTKGKDETFTKID